jgi:hypothetical protein
MCASGVPCIIGNLSTKAIIFLWTSLQSKVYTRNYGPQNGKSLNLKIFKTPNLGVLGQNDIWVQAPWPIIENIIRGKVVVSPKFRS